MSISTLTSREFNRDASKAKRIAEDGPVFITDRGKPAHVLLTVEEYERITNKGVSIVELLAMPDADDVEFEAPRLDKPLYRPADLS
ncbi:MAG: VapB protein (antitoxin to VapC) [uncultured Thiotrichaceae bacterium]|uniref:Antitoxin n=1 Tax=uncultured Thiotrichaceae bacterium TaxID=298394 RepID=A0A6S6TYV0_9GAMM|nr:MAG: VapB protein (antitoxin to VapC) [uncultured Thiotrichaceae bacterium]